MNWKTWVPLALAIVLGLAAMMIAKDYMSKKNGGDAKVAKMTDVVVVKENLMPGTLLKPEQLAMGKMSGDVPSESVFNNISEVEGRVIHSPMFKGQPVLETLLTPKGTGAGLQALVPEGKRAITVEINEFSGVAGFLIPGCHVDVVATVSGEGGEMTSRTIVQNVPVTAIGQKKQNEPGAEPESTKSVTLVTTPKEAEAIELAAATGRPRLVLRSSGDKRIVQSDGVTVAELRGRSRKGGDPFVPVQFSRPAPINTTPTTQPTKVDTDTWNNTTLRRSVKVIRGGVESEVEMEIEQAQLPKWMTNNATEPVLPGQGR